MKKRLFAGLLALCMTVNLMSATAFAEEGALECLTECVEDAHAEGCPIAEAEAARLAAEAEAARLAEEAEKAARCAELCGEGEHVEGCAFYVAPVTCDKTLECKAVNHEADCEKYVVPCTKTDACKAEEHENDCYWYDFDPDVPCGLTEGCQKPKKHLGECDVQRVYEEEKSITVVCNNGHEKDFDSLSDAMRYGESCGIKEIVVYDDITEEMSYLEGNIVSGKPEGVTITNTIVDEWIYCDSSNFTIGEGVTYDATGKASGLFVYGDDCVINGTVIVDCYYQRYADSRLTINAPGSLTVQTETFILRYMDGDAEAGIYINGDNNDATVEFNPLVVYFYQGMINAKDATIKVGTYWQTQGTDDEGSANLVLDNSSMSVTVNEHNFKATGISTVTLKNGSSLNCAGGFETANTTKVTVDSNSKVIAKNEEVEILEDIAVIGHTYYKSFEEALGEAANGATITLLADVETDKVLKIERPVEINGQEQYTIKGTANKTFEVYADTKFDGVHIINTTPSGRCVDTRTKVNLTLNNCWLETTGDKYSQTLTIGGSDAGTTVELIETPIEAGVSGYGIISFVPCELNIKARSHVSGYAAIYMKEGTAGSKVTVENSNLTGSAIDEIFEFGTVVFEDNNITMQVSPGEEGASITANGIYQAALFLNNKNNLTVTVEEGVKFNDADLINGYNIAGNNIITLPAKHKAEIPVVELEVPEVNETVENTVEYAVKNDELDNLKVDEGTKGKLQEIKNEVTEISLVPVTEVVTKDEAEESGASFRLIEELVGGEENVLQYMDLSVEIVAKKTDGNSLTVGTLNEVSEALTFYVDIPVELQTEGRTFYVVRVHEGVAERLELTKVAGSDTKYSFATDKFSDYAVVYVDADDAVAELDGVKHATLESAVAASKGGEVTLLKSVTVNSTINVNNSVIINLNGYDITGEDSTDPVFKVAGGFLELKGKGTVTAGKDAIALYGNEDPNGSAIPAEVTVGEDVTVISDTANCIYLRGNGAVANIYGTLTSNSRNYAAIQGNGTFVSGTKDAGRTEINIYDGASVTSKNNIAIFHPQSGTLNVSGGTITGTTGIEMRAGTLNVTGGTITGKGSFSEPAPNGNGSTSAGVGIAAIQHTTGQGLNVNVSGGTVSGTYALYQSDLKSGATTGTSLNVTGGTFKAINGGTDAIESEDCTGFVSNGSFSTPLKENECKSGLKPTDKLNDGNFSVKEELTPDQETNAEAEVNGIKYSTFEKAVEAVKAGVGTTVKLLTDAYVDATVAINDDVIIDLNGNNITGEDTTDPVFRVENGSLNLTGTGSVTAVKDAIALYGNEDPNGSAIPAEVTVGKGVTVASANANCIYLRGNGAVANIYGKLMSNSSKYAAIQGNGTYNGTTDAGRTEINIYDGASVTSANNIAIFHPQSGILNVSGGTITGTTGIEMRAGTLNVTGGTITGEGTFSEPAPNGNGSTSAGVGIAAIQHTTGQELNVNVSGGTVSGTYALYQSNPETNVTTDTNLNVTGGTFKAINGGTDAIESKDCTGFISGGSSSTPIDKKEAASGYAPTLVNGVYTVAKVDEGASETGSKTIAFRVADKKPIYGKYIDEDSETVKEAKKKFEKWAGEAYDDFEFVLAADLHANIEKNTLIGIYASGVSEYDVVKILHKNHDGNWELVDSEAYNGYVVGEFDELSPVVVFVNEDAARGTDQPTANVPARPAGATPAATGDSANIIGYVTLFALAGVALVTLVYKKRKA